jgi:signal transduction histidine kinase
VTLCLDGLDALDEAGQEILAEYLDAAAPRLVSASQKSLEELRILWRPDLIALLSTVTVEVPSLSEHPNVAVRQANELLPLLASELGRERAPVLSESAAQALAHHGWPGGEVELEALLVRTLLLTSRSTLEVDDLAWSPLVASTPDRGKSQHAGSPLESPGGMVIRRAVQEDRPSLELLAIELAHQLKNPLVTIKTFVDSAPRLIGSGDLGRFGSLASEAVLRLDGVLDQLLSFSRLGPPTPRSCDALEVLDAALRGHSEVLQAKRVIIEREPGSMAAFTSLEHIGFAFDALSHHLADTVEPQSVLRVSVPAAGRLRVCYRECGTTTHLRGVTGDPSSSLPLALLLVRGALTTTGGRMTTEHYNDQVTIEMTFTTV